MSGYTIIIVLAVMVAASSAAYIFAPRGPNQTVVRTSLIMTFVACYLMWAITYLSQLHPLMKPQTKFRVHNADHISP
ncbi:H(+)-transporting V0 sector ATPase subunit e [Actinomortierella ambigua]|nr:H(+)-transporting V0 sector ATPase subunit e [Actinomortierella ambigua]